uniref:Leucine rich repeat neuronal 4 n=1 Tax=Leptobrachium leishanense TaxID=445787 RepID=A0A8C5N2T1_9ANUR
MSTDFSKLRKFIMFLDVIHQKSLLLLLFLILKDGAVMSSATTQTPTQGSTLFTLTSSFNYQSSTVKPCHAPCAKPCINVTLPSRGLDSFPSCLPAELESLDLSYNSLKEIKDEDVSRLSQLRVLNLRNNQISGISWGSNLLPSLEFLDLSYNRFYVVPRCTMLKKVKWLSLAGNDILEIQPYAFNCFPNVEYLNLSRTHLWKSGSEAVSLSAFSLNETQVQETSLKFLQTLDLSQTLLTRVNKEWSNDLPNLTELHLREMKTMKNLDGLGEAFPLLERLNCQNFNLLNSVSTAMFDRTSNLKYINLYNCSLTSISPWNISSSYLEIDLRGNSLECKCQLSWLFSNPINLTLIRANETFCHDVQGDKHLLKDYLYDNCSLDVQNYQFNGTTESSENNTSYNPSFVTSTPSSLIHFQGTPKQSIENTSTLQEKANNLSIVTVYKTTSTDSALTPTMPKLLSSTYDTSTQLSATSTGRTSVAELHTLTAATILGTTAGEERMTGSPIPSLLKLLDVTSSMTVEPMSQQSTHVSTQKIVNKKGVSVSNIKPKVVTLGPASDYANEYDNEDDQPITTLRNKMIPCDYDPCRHHQMPCFELQQEMQCLCPGLSSEDNVPDPPRLTDVTEITDTAAQVHWCSPNSVVGKYQLKYSPAGDTGKTVIDDIHETSRQYTLYNLLPDTTYHLCAVSVNKAGLSNTEDEHLSGSSCTEFKTKPNHIIVMAALGALCGLFLVVTTILSVYLYRMHRNNMVNQYDTHLVSYKNPTFDYQLTIPSYS